MRKQILLIVVAMVPSLAATFLALMVGCGDDCKSDSTRCNGARVELCNADGEWELSVDCTNIEDFDAGIDWMCCVDPSDGWHSCLPSDECNVDIDAGDGGK